MSQPTLAVSLPLPLTAGEPRQLDASTPLPLLGADGTWFLTSGEVDLFVVPTDASGAPGRRTYVATATPGTLLVGCDPLELDGRRWRLLAVGVAAGVVPVRADWADSLSDSPELRSGLHRWLTVTAASPAPGPRVAVGDGSAGQPLPLTAGQVLNAPTELAWAVPDDEVRFRLAGAELDAGLPLPLGAGFAAAAGHGGTVRIERTSAIPTAQVRAAIAQLQSILLRSFADVAVAHADRSAARGAGRHELDQGARRTALARFDQIEDDGRWQADPTTDVILAACQLLGRAAGIDIRKPPDWSRRLNWDPVRSIARASGVRVRAVTLSGPWWRNGLEPMLAFTDPNGDPVVLVPRESGAYAVVDPRTGSEQRISQTDAARLRPTAYVLYRPMPPGAVTIRGLLGFGLVGSGLDLVRLLGFSLVVGVLSLALPVATGTILGELVPLGQPGPVLVAALLLLLVAFATTGFLLSRSSALLRLQGRMLTRMQAGLWDRLIALPVSFFTRFSAADLSLRVNGVDAIQQIVASVASQTLLAVITLVFSLALLFAYDVVLASTVLIATVVVVCTSAFLTVAQIRRLRAMYDAKGAASGVLLQIVQGVDKIRAAAAENRALGAWTARFAPQARLLLSSERLSAARTAIYAMLPSLLTVIVFAAVARDPETMTTAAFLAFVTALGQIAGATAQLDLSFGYALNVLPIFDRMKPILAEPIEVPPGSGDPGMLEGRVELASVTFRYPGMDAPVLHDVSITAEPGEFVALVGPSGSGNRPSSGCSWASTGRSRAP